MTKPHVKQSRLARWIGELAPLAGMNLSSLPSVSFQRLTRGQARHPAIYEPSLKLIGQGSIRGHLGRESFRYDAENYLVLALPLPVECEFQASVDEPLVFMSINLDWALIGGLLAEMGPGDLAPAPLRRAVCAYPLAAALREATLRLLRCLRSPQEARVLGRAALREVFYRVLSGQGEALRAAAARHGGFARVGRALQLLHRASARPLSVDMLARAAGMSVPSFYRHFKAVTATSPQRYLQAIRLHKARALLLDGQVAVASAGACVGYESASQFSREYRRLFGHAPGADRRTEVAGKSAVHDHRSRTDELVSWAFDAPGFTR